MEKILISGRMSRSTLERALYSGWKVESYEGDDKRCAALLKATVANASPEYMAGRLSSFGTVGVRLNPSAADIAEALDDLILLS